MKRMAQSERFYTNFSPRISNVEIAEIEKKLGTLLQREHIAGASAGPIAIYPLSPTDFKNKLKIYLQTKEAKNREVKNSRTVKTS